MKRLILAACTLLAIVSLTGVALAVSDDDSAEQPSTPTAQTVAPVQQVDALISENLAIFREEADASGAEAIAAGTREAFAHIGKYAGANVELARTAQTPDGPVHIVPGDGQVCFIGPGGMACGTSAYLSEHPQSYATFSGSIENPRGTVRVSGIAPDGVTQIDAVSADGATTTIPVRDNAYSGLVPAGADRLEFRTTSRGTLTAPVPDTPSASK